MLNKKNLFELSGGLQNINNITTLLYTGQVFELFDSTSQKLEKPLSGLTQIKFIEYKHICNTGKHQKCVFHKYII